MDLYHLSKFEESSILNPRLHQRIVENIEKDEERQPRGVGGRRTCWNFHTKGIKEDDRILVYNFFNKLMSEINSVEKN